METEKRQEHTTKQSTERSTIPHTTPPGKNQRFIKNDQYFTICIYTFVLVVASAVAVKAIISFDETKAFFYGLFRALGPFLIALLIAYILTPFVKVVQRCLTKCFKRISQRLLLILSMVIVYLVGIGLILLMIIYVLPELVKNLIDLVNQLPIAYKSLIQFLRDMQQRFPNTDFSSIIKMLESTQGELTNSLKDIAADMIPVLYTASVSIVQWAANFLIAVVVSVYMLYGRKSLKRLLKIVFHAFIPDRHLPVVKKLVVECNQIFSRYVISKMIDSLIIGVLCAILMTILRLPYVLLISVVVGITNMIPYFGPFIGAVPGIVIILVISPIKAVVFMIMILCLQQFDGLFLGPKLMGNATAMKPIWIIFAITLGGKFFGVAGMFLGVPVMAIFAYLAEQYMTYRLKKKNMSMDMIQ